MPVTRPEKEFFDALYTRFFPDVYRYTQAIVQDPSVAEEVAQDVFLTALLHLDELLAAEQPKRWLLKTAKYKCMHVFRSRAQWKKWMIPWEDLGREPTAQDHLGQVEEREALHQAKARIQSLLTEEELTLVQLVALEEKSYQAAAQALGITVAACQKRMQRIRKKLRKQFPAW